jgi:hypothetical protein
MSDSNSQTTILTAEQVRVLEDLALRVKGTDEPKALERVAEELSDAVLEATGWTDRMITEHEAAMREGRSLNWEAVNGQ